MKNIGNLEVTEAIFKMVDENLYNHPTKPMTFYITDKLGKQVREFKKMKTICEYFESKFGAEAKQVEDHYTHMAFEITDPVSLQLELFLKSKGTYQEWE